MKGFEPSTPGATVQCSNLIELHSPHKTDSGAPEGTRTPDLRLRRPLLYPPELLAPKKVSSEEVSGKQSPPPTSLLLTPHFSLLTILVGARRFELPTPCAQGRCATRLRYAPFNNDAIILHHMQSVKSRICLKRRQRCDCGCEFFESAASMAHAAFRLAVKLCKS